MKIPNVIHSSAFRCSMLFSGLLLGLASPSLFAQTTTFEPSEWYSSGPAGTPTGDGGIKFDTRYTSDGETLQTGIPYALTYFDPISLSNVGDSLKVSLTFAADGRYRDAAPAYRFAFYDSGSTPGTTDKQVRTNDGGPNNSSFQAYRGYRLDLRAPAAIGVQPFELRARSTNESQLGGGSSHGSIIGNGGPADSTNMAWNTNYDVTYVINRTAEDVLTISFSIIGSNFTDYSASWTITADSGYFYTTFDTFAFLTNGVGLANSVTLNNVEFTAVQVPEAGTVALMFGGGAFAFVVLLRRRLRR